jgi:hypothetical protein
LIKDKEMCGATRAPRFNAAIQVDDIIFNACEMNPSGPDREFCRQHFEATILHELVHWARRWREKRPALDRASHRRR